jgi:hypothetical protein
MKLGETLPTEGLVAVVWHDLFCFFISSPIWTLLLGFSLGYLVLSVIGWAKDWWSLRRLKSQIRGKNTGQRH